MLANISLNSASQWIAFSKMNREFAENNFTQIHVDANCNWNLSRCDIWQRSRVILPEDLLFVVHFRHNSFLRLVFAQFHVRQRLRQLKILLVHFSFAQRSQPVKKSAKNCHECVTFLRDAYDEPRREMSRSVLKGLSVADGVNLSASTIWTYVGSRA